MIFPLSFYFSFTPSEFSQTLLSKENITNSFVRIPRILNKELNERAQSYP